MYYDYMVYISNEHTEEGKKKNRMRDRYEGVIDSGIDNFKKQIGKL